GERGARGHQGPDPRPGVALRLRRRRGHSRHLHLLSATQGRRRSAAAHPHRPRDRLCDARAPQLRPPLRGTSPRVRRRALTAARLRAGLTLIGAGGSERLERDQLERIDQRLRSRTAIVAQASPEAPTVPAEADRAALLEPALDLVGSPYLVYLDGDGEIAGDV